MNPILAGLAASHADRMTVAKVDVDDNRELAERFKIQSIPTLVLFKDGKAVDMKIGALPKAELSPVGGSAVGQQMGAFPPALSRIIAREGWHLRASRRAVRASPSLLDRTAADPVPPCGWLRFGCAPSVARQDEHSTRIPRVRKRGHI